jgi:hypothetical protein
MYPLFLPYCNQSWKFLERFLKILNTKFHKNLLIGSWVFPHLQMDRQMDIHEKFMSAFCNYVNRPKNYMILHCSENHLISSMVISLYYPVMDIYYCLKIMVFQYMTPFSLGDVCQQFGWTCCPHLMVSVRRVGAKLHSITLHETTVFIFTTKRASDHVTTISQHA